jgi:hypothetical protein
MNLSECFRESSCFHFDSLSRVQASSSNAAHDQIVDGLIFLHLIGDSPLPEAPLECLESVVRDSYHRALEDVTQLLNASFDRILTKPFTQVGDSRTASHSLTQPHTASHSLIQPRTASRSLIQPHAASRTHAASRSLTQPHTASLSFTRNSPLQLLALLDRFVESAVPGVDLLVRAFMRQLVRGDDSPILVLLNRRLVECLSKHRYQSIPIAYCGCVAVWPCGCVLLH